MADTIPLLRKQRKVPRALLIVEEYIPGALLGLVAALVSADVVMRYVFNSPIQGAAEVSMMCMVWLVYLSASGISRRGAHISLDLFTSRFGPRGRAIFDILTETLTITVLGVLAFTAIEYLGNARFVVLPATGVSKAFITTAIPVSAVMMMIHSGIFLLRAVIGLRDPDYTRFYQPLEAEIIEDLETHEIRQIARELTGKDDVR